MIKHLRITVDGKAYDVLVEDVTEETGGTLYPSPGTMAQAAAAQTAAVQAPQATPVAPAGGSGGPNDKLSPLAGVVVEVGVKVGDSVKAGQQVLVIEAMKMKTSVSAHKDGKVTAVMVKPGDAVDAGQVMLSIE